MDVHCWLKHKVTGEILDVTPFPDLYVQSVAMLRGCISEEKQYEEYSPELSSKHLRSLIKCIILPFLEKMGATVVDTYYKSMFHMPQHDNCLLNAWSFKKFSPHKDDYSIVFGKMGWKTRSSIWWEYGFDKEEDALSELKRFEEYKAKRMLTHSIIRI